MRTLLLVFTLCTVVSCQKKDVPNPSFYYWKTTFTLSQTESDFIRANGVKNLYMRYFDVGLRNNQPMPISPVYFKSVPKNTTIIPVVFIKNEVFLKTDLDVVDLKNKVLGLVNQIDAANHLQTSEIQIDCDWSLDSRDRFMDFMSQLKKACHKKLSATIRLHQVKYWKDTKVPPVDYGVLMFYNMGTISADATNSIYDRKIAEKYISSLKNYPLPLKPALPVFSWWVHTRCKKVVGLLSKINHSDFKNNPKFDYEKTVVRVKEDTFYKGFFFRKNDVLKLEHISQETLYEMAELISDFLPKKPTEVLFFDLDATNINTYSDANFIKTVCIAF